MRILLILMLLSNTLLARPVVGLNDYGELLDHGKFSVNCVYNIENLNVYSNNQLSCIDIQKIYIETYSKVNNYLSLLKYDLKEKKKYKINIRIVSLEQLNNINNFSKTDKRCMYNIKCDSGAFLGRTFYSELSDNINIYVVYGNFGVYKQYSFERIFKHELLHAMIFKYGLNNKLSDKQEHKIINNFLSVN